MSTPTAAHRKLIDEIRVGDRPMRFDITDRQAAQLLCDSEARAVEAATKYEREELDRIDVIVMELTASRERVRVLEEAEKEANAKLALYRSRVFRVKSILSYIEDDGTEQHHSATPERKEGEQ